MVITTLSRKGSRAYSSAVPRVIFFPLVFPLDHLYIKAILMTAASDTALQKRTLRGRLRSDRDALSAAYRADCAKHALQHLITWKPWATSTLVGSYLPHESEFDPSLLAQAARDRGADIVCPRVNGRSMSFHHWQAGDDAEVTIGGVLQPIPAAPIVDAAAIHLFLTPLLGCGDSGMRLGYGGGFYDRLFAQVGGLRLGVGYALQRVSDWESEAHDQRLDGFLSEEGLTLFDRISTAPRHGR